MALLLKLQKWLSYLVEQHVESAPSDINPHLYVSLSKGRYQLSTANAIYSFEDLYDNFGKAFAHLNWDNYQPNKVLILGGGLLSVPQLLDRYIKNSCIYDVVEIDENVIYLADKYIRDKIKHPIHWHHDSAESFVYHQIRSEVYDLIIVDVFEDDLIPESIEQPLFLQRCQEALSTSGLLLFNRLSRTHRDRTQTRSFANDLFSTIFPDGGYLDVQGNYILFSRPDFWKPDAGIQVFNQ